MVGSPCCLIVLGVICRFLVVVMVMVMPDNNTFPLSDDVGVPLEMSIIYDHQVGIYYAIRTSNLASPLVFGRRRRCRTSLDSRIAVCLCVYVSRWPQVRRKCTSTDCLHMTQWIYIVLHVTCLGRLNHTHTTHTHTHTAARWFLCIVKSIRIGLI